MDEEHTDDMSIQLQLQQFMDEWYYRILHSGMAHEMDKEQAAVKAMDLFECQGVSLTEIDKIKFSKMEDDDMIEAIVHKMPDDVRKTFGHFALQLQLVMSAASRVRYVLDEGPAEEVARVMEDGDAGVNAQILKQTIVEAAAEIGELQEVHGSWQTSTNKRLSRMSHAQAELEQAKRDLERTSIKLGNFADEQSKKSTAVLMSLAQSSDKVLIKAGFSAWAAYFTSYKNEKHLHDKFRKEIDDAERKLMEYKQAQIANVRNVLMRNSEGSERLLLAESVRVWAKLVLEEKEERALAGDLESARQKMGGLKMAQKDNAKKSMIRMCQGNDESLTNLCLQEWAKITAEERKNKAFNEEVRAQEAKMQQYLKGKNEQAKGVLNRMAGSSETGLLHGCFSAWAEDLRQEKKAKEVQDTITAQNQKFANLNVRMKANASSSVARANEMEEENQIMTIFMNWATEAKLGRVARHYAGQMDTKKQQLDAVQTMFKSFASQLEQGIGNTPRTTRKSNRGSSRPAEAGGHAARPPLPA
mmetsp:Transcript_19202/g.55753  ORF Transcript_19202/g.55753 Transcript_19202/m.55753 type:complete len:529 (-) Transcript_19202:20-1606(-)